MFCGDLNLKFLTVEILLLLLTCFCGQIDSSPFNRVRRRRNDSMATRVDCQNMALVEQMDRFGIPFRCYPGSERFMGMILETANPGPNQEMNIIAEKNNRGPSPNDILDFMSDAPFPLRDDPNCSDPRRCKKSQMCPRNMMYVPKMNRCMPRRANWDMFNRDQSIYYDRNYPMLSQNECNFGFSYHFETGRCLPNGQIFPVYYDNMPESSKFQSNPRYDVIRCPQNNVFVAEIGICVPNRRPMEASLIRPQSDSPQVDVQQFVSNSFMKGCPNGFLYNPEVDLCLPFKKMTDKDIKEMKHREMKQKLEAANLMFADSPYKSSFEDSSEEFANRHKCKDGKVYNSEIDLCVEIPEQMLADSPKVVIKTTEKPFRLTLAPLTPDQIGASKCKKGQVYISELDFCIDMPQRPSN